VDTGAAPTTAVEPDAEGEALGGLVLAHLTGAGYRRLEPPILQPASVFLDLSGEDIRGRLFLTSDGDGTELCLRPDYTIPVARSYLASNDAGHEAAYSYLGPVFRSRPGASGEFVQAGLESFGRADAPAADAEILAVAIEAASAAGHGALDIEIGDVGLFARLLEALALPPLWLRRLRRGFAQGHGLDAILAASEARSGADHSGVLAALAGIDRTDARALVEDVLSIAGIASVGGRSAGEIAERFLEQAAERTGAGLAGEQREVLTRFLAVAGDPDGAAAAMRRIADEATLDLGEALDLFDARTGFLAARGVDVTSLRFAARFGRHLDYYTGFVFEAREAGRLGAQPLIGGGRYDGLLRTLGAARGIPAVGAALWVGRLARAGGTAAPLARDER
jgi:ATP phosphoribosyltransferase regulatory subunit